MAKAKFNVGDSVRANEKAPGDYEGQGGTVVERGPHYGEYGVAFPYDPRSPVHYLNSWQLDRCESGAPTLRLLNDN